MEISFYHEEPFEISNKILGTLYEKDIVVNMATSNFNFEQVEDLGYERGNINIWPVFPKFKNLLLSIATGTYWLTKENIKELDKYINLANEIESKYFILDIEVLPMWKEQFGDNLTELVDNIHGNGIKVKVTTTPQTPLEILPKNADIISMQTYSHLRYWTGNLKERLNITKKDYELLKKEFPDNEIGLDIGGLNLDSLPFLKKICSTEQPKRISSEIKTCEALGINNVSIYDLRGSLDFMDVFN